MHEVVPFGPPTLTGGVYPILLDVKRFPFYLPLLCPLNEELSFYVKSTLLSRLARSLCKG